MGLDGALIVDKPSGITSHDVVARVRRVLGTSRIGHTGTLDPSTTGLLVLLVGRATRLAQFLALDSKEYIADIRLGISTPTYDAESLPDAFRLKAEATEAEDTGPEATGPEATGPEATEAEATAMGREATEAQDARAGSEEMPRGVRRQAEDPPLLPMPEAFTVDAIEGILPEFRGTYWQVPPPYSAKKVAGTRAYALARRNQHVELKPSQVTAREIELLHYVADGLVRLRVACSAGFYVRSLAHDIGQRLGCGAHLEALRRTQAGRFTILDAAPLDELERDREHAAGRVLGMNDVLADIPALTLGEHGARRASHGNTVAPDYVTRGLAEASGHSRVRLLDSTGTLLGVAEHGTDGLLHPIVVLV